MGTKSGKEPCRFQFTINGFFVQTGNKTEATNSIERKSTRDNVKCFSRLHLIRTKIAPNHSPTSSLLRKELGNDFLLYTKELQSRHYMKLTDLVPFLERRLEFRINGTVLRQNLCYIANCNVTRDQESLLLVKTLQVLQSQEPGTRSGIETLGMANALQNVWWT